jgi:hypothetical protein
MKYLIVIIICFCCLSFSINKTVNNNPWNYIFNGKDFTGWKLVGANATAKIEDSAFVGNMKANTNEHTFITTTNKYSDFILELDVNADSAFNTGILLRCKEKPTNCDTCKVSLYGYQVKIDPSLTRKWSGGIFDDFGAKWNWMYDLDSNNKARNAYYIAKWNHFRIEAIGNNIKVWVNNVPATNLTNKKYTEGFIALKIHSLNNFPEEEKKAGRFKNIRIITKRLNKYKKQMDMPEKVVG